MQLSNSVSRRKEHRPVLSDVKNICGIDIADSADVLMFLYRENYYNKKIIDDVTELIIVKNEINNVLGTIKLKWIKELNRYE